MQAAKRPQYSDVTTELESGFSLIELMITLAVGSILLAVAIPSFQSLMSSNQLTATTNTLVFSLQTARSEAIKRALHAGVCTSNNSQDPEASCSNGSGYVGGWIAYVDNNSNGTRDVGEDIVMAVEDRGPGFTISPDAMFVNQVYFDEAGGSTNTVGVPLSGAIGITYADGSETRSVQVAATGRISTVSN